MRPREQARMQWPSRGYCSFNLANYTEFQIPKSHQAVSLERALLAGTIGHEREVRREQAIDITQWIKGNYNFLQIGKFATEDPYTYASAVYLTKRVRPFEYVDHVHRSENEFKLARFGESYNLLLREFAQLTAAPVSRLGFSLRCPITLSRIKYAYRGSLCTHFQTFDLETYITLNDRSPRWVCPVCGAKTTTLRRCPIME